MTRAEALFGAVGHICHSFQKTFPHHIVDSQPRMDRRQKPLTAGVFDMEILGYSGQTISSHLYIYIYMYIYIYRNKFTFGWFLRSQGVP